MTALFAKLSAATFSTAINGSTTWTTTSRRLKLWADVPKTSRPYMCMTEHHESQVFRKENTPGYITMLVDVFVYINSEDMNTVPSIILNTILDALDASIAPGPGEQRQTLGGLVSHCRVDGPVLKDPGDIDGDGLLIYPIKITST
jgi:hypothetical protein